MNGKTAIDAIHNPASAEMDRRTYGVSWLNVCFWGKRLIRVTIGRLMMDIYVRTRKPFTCMGGGERPLLGNRCGKTAKSHWIVFSKPNA